MTLNTEKIEQQINLQKRISFIPFGGIFLIGIAYKNFHYNFPTREIVAYTFFIIPTMGVVAVGTFFGYWKLNDFLFGANTNSFLSHLLWFVIFAIVFYLLSIFLIWYQGKRLNLYKRLYEKQ